MSQPLVGQISEILGTCQIKAQNFALMNNFLLGSNAQSQLIAGECSIRVILDIFITIVLKMNQLVYSGGYLVNNIPLESKSNYTYKLNVIGVFN